MLIIFLFLLALLHHVNSQKITEISLSHPLNGSIIYENSSEKASASYYKFYLNSFIDYPELLIMAFPFSKYSDPDLFISQKNEYPSTFLTSEKICYSTGLDICALTLNDLILDAWIYIAIVCYRNCSYSLRIDASYLNESLYLNNPSILKFSETSSKIMRFYVSEIPKNSHILLATIPLNPESLNETFHIYLKQGNQVPSSSNNDYSPSQIWHQGKGFSLSHLNLSPHFLYNCNYTLLVEAFQGAFLLMTATLYNEIRTINLNIRVRDIIQENEIHYYELKLAEFDLFNLQNTSLIFKMRVYSGDPDLYIHYDSRPEELAQYEWVSLEIGSEGIAIMQSNLQVLNASGMAYYIAIQGKMSGAYEFEVFPNIQEINVINFEETISGMVLNGESVNYRLSINGYNSSDLIVEAITKAGNIRVYLSLCCEKKLCKILDKNQSFLAYENNDVVKILKFHHNSSECSNSNKDKEYNKCYYAILIEGANQVQKTSRYSLSIKRKDKLQDLKPNEVVRNQLMQQETIFYQYSISNADMIKSMQFQINLIAGDAIIYYSKTISFPNSTYHDKMINYADFIDLTFNQADISAGNYYLSIEAQTLLDYMIIVLIEKEGGNNTKPTYIQLLESQPMKFQSEDLNKQFFFEIYADFHDSNGSIFINMKPIWGFFVAWILEINKNNTLKNPSEDYHDYTIDEEQVLTIKSKSGVLVYRIMIEIDGFLKKRPDLISQFLNYQFSLMYTTSESIIYLRFDESYSDSLLENQRRFFRIKYDKKENNLKIQYKIDNNDNNSDLKFWISFEENNLYPSYSLHDFELNSSQKTLTFNNDTLMRYCKEKNICNMYIGVENFLEVHYSILILRDFSSFTLKDGEIASRPLLNKDEYYTFSYKITTNNSLSIFFSSFDLSYFLYASILKKNDSLNYPNFLKNDYFSHGSSQFFSEVIIPSKTLQKNQCFIKGQSNNCILLINITAMKNDKINKNHTEFQILVSSIITPLKEAIPLTSSLEEGMIKYFSISITDPNVESLIISVSPLGEGDPDIIVSKGKNKRPTFDSYDWKMASLKGDQLKISKGTSEKTMNMKGTYIIGVFGFTGCSFIINGLYSKSVQSVNAGYFTEILFENVGDYQLLEYFHWGEKGFKVLGVIETGDAMIIMNSFVDDQNNEYIQSFPQIDSKIWDSKSVNRDIIMVETNEKNYCSNCLYLLNVIAFKVPCKLSVLIEENMVYSHIPNDKRINDFIITGDQSLYTYKTNTGLMEMNLVVLAGEIAVFIGEKDGEWVHRYGKENFTANHLTVKLGKNFELVDYFINESNELRNNPRDFYVLIRGIMNANCSLRFSSANQLKILRFGVTDYAVIGPEDTQTYRFSSHFINETVSILIVNNNITDHNRENLPTIQLTSFIHDINTEIPVDLKDISIRPGSILLKFQSEAKAYNMKIINKHTNESLSYTLLINAKDAEIIDTGSEERLMVLGLNQAHIYELYSLKNLSLYVEVIECFGKVKLQATQSYLNTVSNEYDWDFQYPYDNNHILTRFNVNKGPVFLQVKSIARDEDFNEDSLYLIRTFMVDRGEKIPQESFFPGNSGVFSWKFNEENVMFVDFSTIECINSCRNASMGGFKVLLISYTLHITRDMRLLNSYGRCDLNIAETRNYEKITQSFEYEKHPKKSQFNNYLNRNETFFINIIAEVWGYYPNLNNFQGFKILYKQQEVINLTKEQIVFEMKYLIIVGIGLVLMGIFIGLCCYYRKKNKKLEKKVFELVNINAESGEIFEANKADKNDHIEYKDLLRE